MIDTITSDELKDILLNGTPETIKKVITNIHRLIFQIFFMKTRIVIKALMDNLPNDVVASIIEEEDDEDDQYDLLKLFSDAKQKEILDEMSNE